MNPAFLRIEWTLLVAWALSWLVAALVWRRSASVKAPRRSFSLTLLLTIPGIWLIYQPFPTARHLWPVGPAFGPVLGWAMVALMLAGIAFAWWARLEMKGLWSGGIMRTPEHHVLQSGPFAIVRHPIYTGLIAAIWAIALTRATLPALGGGLLFAAGFAIKARAEERFLQRELGGYEEYRRRVPMLVPGLRPGLFGNPGGHRP